MNPITIEELDELVKGAASSPVEGSGIAQAYNATQPGQAPRNPKLRAATDTALSAAKAVGGGVAATVGALASMKANQPLNQVQD